MSVAALEPTQFLHVLDMRIQAYQEKVHKLTQLKSMTIATLDLAPNLKGGPGAKIDPNEPNAPGIASDSATPINITLRQTRGIQAEILRALWTGAASEVDLKAHVSNPDLVGDTLARLKGKRLVIAMPDSWGVLPQWALTDLGKRAARLLMASPDRKKLPHNWLAQFENQDRSADLADPEIEPATETVPEKSMTAGA